MSSINRVALVGFGAIASNAHLPALKKLGITPAAIAEISELRRREAMLAIGKENVYSSSHELFSQRSDFDAVIITTPPLYHSEAIMQNQTAAR